MIEAFVAAGLLLPEEAGMEAPSLRPLSAYKNAELAILLRDVTAEARRRLTAAD